MNRDVARGQDIGNGGYRKRGGGGGGGALRVGRKVGDNMWEWAG